MDRHVTVVNAPGSASPTREIVIDTEVLRTGDALADRLAGAGHTPPFTVNGAQLRSLARVSDDVQDGAVIVCGVEPAPPGHQRLPHLVFVVRSGPDAGQVIPLTRGSYSIGRAESDIVVADPAMSRHQALLRVGEHAIELEDLDSANGTFVDGERITTAAVSVAQTLRFGESGCSIELADGAEWAPGPHDVLTPLALGLDVPARPSRILVLTAFLPLLLGVVLALTTGMWFFLAFSALSAVTGMVPLLTYRRTARVFARRVSDAAEQDRVRRTGAVPDPGQTALDALRCGADLHRGPCGTSGEQPASTLALLRLGLARQPAHLSVARAEPAFTPPLLPPVPLLVPCSAHDDDAAPRTVTITGGAGAVRALAHALLLQLAHPGAASPPVLCWGGIGDVPQNARFLPNVRLTHDPNVLGSHVCRPTLVLVLQFSEDLPDLGAAPEVCVVRFLAGDEATPIVPAAGDRIMIRSGSARARIDGAEYDLSVDGVSPRAFERTARLIARSVTPGTAPRAREAAGALPPSASLWSEAITPRTLAATAAQQWASAPPDHPVARLGQDSGGGLSLDLVKDGPHLLVAGTTGSGKSEFLRTLVLGLAMSQPPHLLTMLLIDYKGGSGLAALAALPHCVGALTDLSSESTARALTSLRAELRRREGLCADHGVSDLGELRVHAAAACPPRLVVVIDEFRMLSEDVPTAVQELLKIAALGRSLGVHLVLATQRAQGAVTPELRANITSAVLLRVQTAMESHDLLGSGAAAEIEVDSPGRAYLRRGGEAPVAFQVASSSTLPDRSTSIGWQDLAAYLEGEAPVLPAGGDGEPDGHLDRSDATPAAGVLDAAVAALGVAAGNTRRVCLRPVLPPLPTQLSEAGTSGVSPVPLPGGLPGRAPLEGTVPLGIADYPEAQDQRLLRWSPRAHSHLALVGLVGSGAAAALVSVVTRLPGTDPDVHLYVLDGDGTLAAWAAAGSPQLGAYVRSDEIRRAARVLDRLASRPPWDASTPTHILLVITGWGHWCTNFRQGRGARAEDDLHSLARDGASRGVSVLLTGDRELTTARFFAHLPNRVYLPLGAHQETTITWPKLPPLDAVAGRGFAQGPIMGTHGEGACQLVTEPGRGEHPGVSPARTPALTPFPVHPLPDLVLLDQLRSPPTTGQGRRTDAIPLGVYGDDLATFSVNLSPGEVYLVLGPPGSGRSTALRVLAESAERVQRQRRILAAPAAADTADYWRGVGDRGIDRIPPEMSTLLVDDVDQLPADVQQILAALVARGAAAVLCAAPGPALLTRVPLALQARGSGRGLILGPRTPADGDFFGVRHEVEGRTTAGRAWACEPGGVVDVQIARLPDGSLPVCSESDPGADGARAFFRHPRPAR
ncbi:FHA domain-containing protein [Arthrobacter echini]|uniref:FHA domain-containing protein n=1 Tax=Arthrobacter echini TaxID=1529066 RepID=A0A4S5E3F8_9MICC|nr:FtsK/SpoIIIE domain-containing protein [Arthrobacter echini]THJ65965.1 FHA domain-containing protein [Arthrobacter echini]